MAAAMARGWAAGDGGPDGMLFCDLDAERAAAIAGEVGGETRPGLRALADDTDVVLLAVKPAALDEVVSELGGSAPALISVLAATPLDRLENAFPGIPLVRVMPNQPVEIRRGVLCHPPPRNASPQVAEELLGLLAVLGTLVAVDESQIDATMAVMSCSPAYLALVAEALADAGAREGLEAALSLRLVRETLAGTAELLAACEPAEIRRRVAPPGGATEAGLEALETGGVETALDAAVYASLERFR